MNWANATKTIGVDNIPISELNMKIIKQKYHKLSLLHHPDKNNNTEEAKIKFQEINEAYTYLSEIYYYENDENDDIFCETTNEDFFYNNKSFSFSYFLKIFIQSLFEKKYSNAVYNVVNDIINNYKAISIQLFDGLEKENCLMIYMFLMKYKNLLHLDQEIINQIRDIILKKYDNVYCYKLNPKLNDLFENNVYKLIVKDETYIVPLWHNELYFSSNNNDEIIVFCEPILQKNINIDENNNIIIDFNLTFDNLKDLMKNNNNNIDIDIDVNRKITIELSKLYMKTHQTFVLQNKGISIIKDDIYDIEEKSDIIINVKFDL